MTDRWSIRVLFYLVMFVVLMAITVAILADHLVSEYVVVVDGVTIVCEGYDLRHSSLTGLTFYCYHTPIHTNGDVTIFPGASSIEIRRMQGDGE